MMAYPLQMVLIHICWIWKSTGDGWNVDGKEGEKDSSEASPISQDGEENNTSAERDTQNENTGEDSVNVTQLKAEQDPTDHDDNGDKNVEHLDEQHEATDNNGEKEAEKDEDTDVQPENEAPTGDVKNSNEITKDGKKSGEMSESDATVTQNTSDTHDSTNNTSDKPTNITDKVTGRSSTPEAKIKSDVQLDAESSPLETKQDGAGSSM